MVINLSRIIMAKNKMRTTESFYKTKIRLGGASVEHNLIVPCPGLVLVEMSKRKLKRVFASGEPG
jgi:hypothetical protein